MNKLVLGTVQFGLKYGINNIVGKPSLSDSLRMLEYAWENGVRIFDTAEAYGNAEEILGIFIKTNGIEKEIKVISKLLPNCLEDDNGSVEKIVYNHLNCSLKKLNLDKLNGYLFHTPGYIYRNEVWEIFKNLKSKSLVENIGVSVYEYEDGVYAIQKKDLDYLQISYSILDQRFNSLEFKNLRDKSNAKVFARSAFLQGLLFMDDKDVEKKMPEAKIYLEQIKDVVGKNKISMPECFMKFSLEEEFVDYLVFGVDNFRQLKEDIEVTKQNSLLSCKKELQNKFKDIPNSIIFPSLWKRD